MQPIALAKGSQVTVSLDNETLTETILEMCNGKMVFRNNRLLADSYWALLTHPAGLHSTRNSGWILKRIMPTIYK